MSPFVYLHLPLALFSISGFLQGLVNGGDATLSPSDLTKLVYRGCSAQKLPDPSGIFSENINHLFDSLISQSSAGKLFSAAVEKNAVKGLYQCRGDLSGEQCRDCVSKLPEIADKLCGRTAAVRVHLSGCYLRYEAVGFDEPAATDLLYKICGKERNDRFGEVRDEMEKNVEEGMRNGSFWAGRVGDVYGMGQCEGGLGSEECWRCVKSGFEGAKERCGESSVSAQVYLSRCYVSYRYYPNGVPTISSSGKKHTQRTIAIVLGGLAAVGFLIASLMFVKSAMKKKQNSRRSSNNNNKHGGEWY